MKTTEIKTIKVDSEGRIDIRYFKDFLNIDDIAFYRFSKGKEPNTAKLTFYDKNKKVIIPKKAKKKKAKNED